MARSPLARLATPARMLACLVLVVASVATPLPAEAKRVGFVPDELLVGFYAGLSDAQAQDVYRGLGGVKLEKIRGLPIHRIRVPAGALTAIETQLRHHPAVRFVERNGILAPDLTANDPYDPSEWHLSKIMAPQAWDTTQGEPQVVIAVVDTGIDPAHPDLAAKLVPGYNFYANNTDTSDAYGHGTKVAGAAAAISNNGLGVASVAWQNLIMPARVSDTSGYAYYSTVASALTWAVDHGAKVMNVSIGGVAGSSAVTSAAQYVMQQGGVVVAAAGNCGCFDSTAPNPYMISVSATDSSDNLASWSSQGDYVDVSAPGASILTTLVGGGYGSVSGTSFSSPITAGVVALMMSVNPSLSPTDLQTLLEANADDLGPAGWDPAYGYGRVNAYRAVAAAAASAPAPDTTPPTASITSPAGGSTVSGSVTVTVAASDDTGVVRVDLYRDGTLVGSDTTAKYGIVWDTTQEVNGLHTLQAVARDAAGNAGPSSPVSVDVENSAATPTPSPSPDTTAPTVSITALSVSSNGKRLSASVAAADDVGVTKVELYVDGQRVGTDTATPYTFGVNLRAYGSGQHQVQAMAYDAAGNVGLSALQTFTK
jgi:subtilisin family serine protease